jgi:TetR/AcrR family transcriptional repressor of bet genes
VKTKRIITRSLPEERHEELIQATVKCLVEKGPIGASVRSIADAADVSPGLITYHFGGKQELFVRAYRHLSQQMREAEGIALREAGSSGEDRLFAFLRVGFEPPFLTQDYITARFLFWGLARSDVRVAQAHAEVYAKFRSDLRSLIAEAYVLDPDELNRMVFALSAMLDGLWLEWCLNPDTFNVDDMLSACRIMLEGSRGTQAQPQV